MNRTPSHHRTFVTVVAASMAFICASPSAVFAADAPPPADQPAAAKKPAPKKPADDTQPADESRSSTSQRSFTDDDLQKYHKPKPAPDTEQATGAAPAPPPAVPAVGGTKSAAPKPAAAKTAAKKPKPNVVAPPPDPAQLALAKSALDAARERELKARRDRIDAFETRLQYLRGKRDAILNPTGAQMGGTGQRAYQYDQNGKPVVDPATGKPVTRPDISPGHGNAPVAPMFVPLPEAQTDDDREKDRTMKVKDLLASVEAEITSVEADLESARAELIDYETRFAPGAGAP
jgi:hypothetical protein